MGPSRQHQKVKKADWKTKPMHSDNTILSVHREFTCSEFKELQKGILPQQMEDKWFIYFEDNCLYFHRSWTGYCIYVAKFKTVEGKDCITKVILNRRKNQCGETNDPWDLSLLLYLIDSMLLHKSIPFPKHPEIDSEDKQVLKQWGIVGRHMLHAKNNKL